MKDQAPLPQKQVDKGIIRRMKYVYRMRKLVKIVYDETSNPTDIITEGRYDRHITVEYALLQFQALSNKYTIQIAKATLAEATEENRGLIGIIPSKDQKIRSQRLIVKGNGITLLHPTGFINELGGSIGKVSPVISVILSLAAIVISIIAIRTR